ncbi:MAG: hypothetical protein HY923_07390 [Elusimicrobia bacterium]|nr:hypothetical protein [Elusimicrobiota bacterium]
MKLILAAVIAAAFVLPARAEDAAPAPKAKSSWGDFLKNLKSALSQSAVSGERKKGKGAQGVAAVRGDDQTKKNIADPNEPGLKGDAKAARAKRDMAYDQELEAAVDQLSKGKLEEGLKALETFKAAHPKHRASDVDGAIEGAKAQIAEKGGAPAAKE